MTFGFERRIGVESWATREGEMEYARRRLLEQWPGLGQRPSLVLESLAKAEHSWLKVGPLREFDFGAVIVSFTKAVECYFRTAVPECPPGEFGRMIGHLRRDPRYRHLVGDLEVLDNLRRRAPRPRAHEGRLGPRATADA